MKLEELEKHCNQALTGIVGSYFDCGSDEVNEDFIKTVLKLIAVAKEAKSAQSWMEMCGFDNYPLNKLFEELEK